MPKQTTHVRVVREWLTSLGILAAVSLPREEAQLRLAAFVPLLMDRFPDAAFTTASLQHVAGRAVKGFPTYGELAAWLAEWWREHRPAPPALPAPPPIRQRDEPTPDEIAHVERATRETIVFLADRMKAKATARAKIEPRHFNDRQLLEEYRRLTLSASDDILRRAAAMRVVMLERKLGLIQNGRKRTDDATLSAAPIYADASSSTADEDETAPG
jgi:hypothetical protein